MGGEADLRNPEAPVLGLVGQHPPNSGWRGGTLFAVLEREVYDLEFRLNQPCHHFDALTPLPGELSPFYVPRNL